MSALWAAALCAVLLVSARAGDVDDKGEPKNGNVITGSDGGGGQGSSTKIDKDGNPRGAGGEKLVQGIYGGRGDDIGKGFWASISSEFDPAAKKQLAEFGSSPAARTAGSGSELTDSFFQRNTGPQHAYEADFTPHQVDAYRKQNPEDPFINRVIGVRYAAAGDHAAALPYFETAIGGGITDPRTMTYAALSALNTGDYRKASDYAAQAAEANPAGPFAEQARSIASLAQRHVDAGPAPTKPLPPPGGADGGSIPELEQPLPPKAADPGLPPEAAKLLEETNRLVAQASKAYRAGDIKEAERLAGEALAKDPEDVRALQVRAAAEAKTGNWEEARKDAERGLDLAPGYVPLLLLRAAAAAHAKDWRAARADAQQVLAKERANPTAWRFMGLAQAGLGQRSDAVASLAKAAGYGDAEAARLLSAARALPPGAEAADLLALLSGAAERAAAPAETAAPAAPRSRRGKTAAVLGAAVLAGVVAGGLILLAGRRDSESV